MLGLSLYGRIAKVIKGRKSPVRRRGHASQRHRLMFTLAVAAFTLQTGFAPIHQLAHATDAAAFAAFDEMRSPAPSQPHQPLPAHPQDNCPLCRLAAQGLPTLAAPPVLPPPSAILQVWQRPEPAQPHRHLSSVLHWHSRAPPAADAARPAAV